MRRSEVKQPNVKVRRGTAPGMVSVTEISDAGRVFSEAAETHEVDTSVTAELSAGDVDARWDQAESSGEETAGGSVPTPDQDIVDEIGKAIGVTYQEGEPLRVGDKEQQRDEHRWELDPASAEDYRERSSAVDVEREPLLKMRHHDRYTQSGPEKKG